MSLTKIQIISQALSQLGVGAISTIESDNPAAVLAESAYDFLYPATLSKENWRFATKVQQLTKLVTTPIIDEWQNAFQLPADYLVAVRTYPLTRYQIYEDQIYANNDDLTFEYRFHIEETKAPFYFSEYMIYVLAEYLALSIAEKIEYVQELRQKRISTEDRAIFLDSQSHSNFAIQSNPFVDVRFGGEFIGSGR